MENSKSAENTQGAEPLSAPAINLPKGGGAIRGIGEKFAANPVTGTGSLSVPIAASPGRSGFGPQLSLGYDSGAGNGPFGLGWDLSLPSITRKTDKGLPRYRDAEESDVFLLSGAEDLVPQLNADGTPVLPDHSSVPDYTIHRYRPRIEGLFARIERWTHDDGDVHWRSYSKDNVLTLYGKDAGSRIAEPEDPADPDKPRRIFSWLISETRDDKGNAVVYDYKHEDGIGVDLGQASERNRGDADDPHRATNRYLKGIRYGNRTPLLDDAGWRPRFLSESEIDDAQWMFQVIFDYGEHDADDPHPDDASDWGYRDDPFSSYRAGFEVRSCRLCRRVLMFHHFPEDPPEDPRVGNNCLVRSTDFDYGDGQDPGRARSPIYSRLQSVTQSGYRRDDGGYVKRSLPSIDLSYTEPVVQDCLETIDPKSLENLPIGVDGARYRWTDLYGEGIPGILTEQAGTWFYKRNLSPIADRPAGTGPTKTEPVEALSNQTSDQAYSDQPGPVEFGPLERVATKPNASLARGARFMDLAGDGQPDLVLLDAPTPGLYEHDGHEGWQTFRPFTDRLNRNSRDPNLRFVDLDGDGHADILITEDDALVWHASLAEAGFGPARRVAQALNEEQGPRLVFADRTDSIYLADLSGDGLTDLVRIRNGEVCYWPNLGYARFGAKVAMDHAPLFDDQDQFDQQRIRLADIDGTGTTDIIYLHGDGVRLYFNQSGNGWSAPQALAASPRVDNLVGIVAADLLGNGTACLVWSSPLPGDAQQPMRYIKLMGAHKPHLLVGVRNNLGAETEIEYAASTKFYLQDRRDGRPWITRLPFPVHVVERVLTYDHVSGNLFISRYAYHHGSFDGVDREFRGFGMVEQWDTEEFDALSDNGRFPRGDNIDQASDVPPVLTRTWYHTGIHLGRDRVSRYFEGEYYREPGLSNLDFHAQLLPDTPLSAGLTDDEEHEACRALKGSMLRQEVYALDGSDREPHPYTVAEQNFSVRRVQPKAGNRHGVFFTHPREAITYHYEREPADPRIGHALTLEVDDFGNVLKSAAIGYGRRDEDSDLPTQQDRDQQTRTLITYTENTVTEAIDLPIDDPGYDPDNYRTPLPCETRSYQLTGVAPANDALRFGFDEWADDDGFPLPDSATEIPYEETPDDNVAQKRPIEHARTRYRKNDLSGLLSLGALDSLALPGESYQLTFTPGLLDQVYRRDEQPLLPDPAGVLGGTGADQGGYRDLDGDGHWWIPSGRVYLSPGLDDTAIQELDHAQRHFYLPYRYSDPFQQTTRVDYDPDDLLVLETTDPVGNRVTVGERRADGGIDNGNDYRVLQPRLVMDPNGNLSQAAFDALGLVVGTAVKGKPGEPVGDSLDDFDPDPPLETVRAQLRDADHDPHDLLQRATTRLFYDLFAYQDSRDDPVPRPATVCTIARETHDADLDAGEQTRIQQGWTYSDGFGREVQTKVQTEPGPVDGVFVENRWVGSGWTIFNNKGKPVRQYEPFFTGTHGFQRDVRIGVSPTLFYDPLQRVVGTLHPNHTWEKVVFDPWRQQTWDVNDTVLVEDPQNDPHLGDFFRRLPDGEYLPTWYAERKDGGLGPEEQAAADKAAGHAGTPATAWLDTLGRPFLTRAHNRVVCPDHELDGSDETFHTRVEQDIEGNQRIVRDAITETTDAQGNKVVDPLGRIVMRWDYSMAGPEQDEDGEPTNTNLIHQASMEAGERWTLNDVTGQPIRAWDSRGHRIRSEYDSLRRPLRNFVTGTDPAQPDQELLTDRLVYGEQHPEAPAHNLRGMLYLQLDQAGAVANEGHDFKGNLLHGTRRLAIDYKHAVQWQSVDDALPADAENAFDPDALQGALSPLLEDETFSSRTRFDALSRPIQLIAPHSNKEDTRINVIQPGYNEANLLEGIDVWLNRSSEPSGPLDPAHEPPSPAGVDNIDYDAKGQRTLIRYRNGTETRYGYDPKTYRLIALYTRRGADFHCDCENLEPPPDNTHAPEEPEPNRPCGLQNLHYSYDPAGNITHIRDDAQQTIYFANTEIKPHADYCYDALYRLIQATGREHLGENGQPLPHSHDDAGRVDLPHPNDGHAMDRYTERYVYDAIGNFLAMQHRGANARNGGWTRGYEYLEQSLLEPAKTSNRLSRTTIDGTTETYSSAGDGYDAHGNMLRMPHLSLMQWDYRDQLQATATQVRNDGTPETTYYVYDAGGQRVRKVTESDARPGEDAARSKERIYLGGFEVYRTDGSDSLERETLHIMDDQQRIALVETRTQGSDGSPEQLIRYQFGNHLGSASLELDGEAQIISYEEYTPYGSTAYQAVRNGTETPTKRYRFTGKERDEETGFNYHGARYYVPWLGRWTSVDPSQRISATGRYVYGGDNPVTMRDDTGFQDRSVFEIAFDRFLQASAIDPSKVAASTAERILWRHRARIREGHIGTHYGIESGWAAMSEEERYFRVRLRISTTTLNPLTAFMANIPMPDPTSCIDFVVDVVSKYIRSAGPLPDQEYRFPFPGSIAREMASEQNVRSFRSYVEKSRGNLRRGRGTAAIKWLQDILGFRGILVYTGSTNAALQQEYNQRASPWKKVGYRGIMRNGVFTPKNREASVGGVNVTAEVTEEIVGQNASARLRQIPFAMGVTYKSVTGKGWGYHTFILAQGVVYEAHWGKGAESQSLFEKSNIADFLNNNPLVFVAVPP